MPNNSFNPSLPADLQEEAARGAFKDHQEKVRVALAGLAAAHTQAMQQTPNRSWLMHYYDDLISHSWDPFGQLAQLAQAQGRKVIGTFCVFAPDELIYAAGGLPVRLDAGADEAISEGEQELGTVNLCPMIKSSMGLKRLNLPFAGEAGLDLVIIPSVCDGKKKLVDFFSHYVPSWMIQVPHTSLDPRVRDYWRTEIRLLRENLESFTGHKIKPKELSEAIRIFNRKRRVIRRLYELRQVPNPPISGRDALLVTATYYHDDPLRWVEQTERLCLELEEHARRGIGVGKPGALRLMLAGCPIVPPNWKVPDILEELGAIIVTDELCTGSRGYWYLVGEDGRSVDEMVSALADRYIMCECPCFVPNTPRIKRIVENVQAWKVNGVVYYQLTFCHTLNLEAVEVERGLDRVGVPMCKIDTDYSEQGAEALRTRLESFLETLGSTKGQAAPGPAGAAGQPAQPAPFWMALTLPPDLAGEVETVATSRTPSGPLSKPKTPVTPAKPVAPPPAAVQPAPPAPPPAAPAPQPAPPAAQPAAAAPPPALPAPQPPTATKILETEAAASAPATMLLSSFHLITPNGKKIPLVEGNEYTLGRAASKSPQEIDLSGWGADPSQGISRKHARLVVTRENCVLEDLGSRNGTFVNGYRLGTGERCTLTGGERILLGQYTLDFRKE